MKVEVPIPGCCISADLCLHNESDTDLHQRRVWRAAFLKGIQRFLQPSLNLNLQSALWFGFFLRVAAPHGSTPQGKDLTHPT